MEYPTNSDKLISIQYGSDVLISSVKDCRIATTTRYGEVSFTDAHTKKRMDIEIAPRLIEAFMDILLTNLCNQSVQVFRIILERDTSDVGKKIDDHTMMLSHFILKFIGMGVNGEEVLHFQFGYDMIRDRNTERFVVLGIKDNLDESNDAVTMEIEVEEFSGHKCCQYGRKTVFGLTCPYSCNMHEADDNFKFPCPEDSGTDGKRNGVCYSYGAFEKRKKTIRKPDTSK